MALIAVKTEENSLRRSINTVDNEASEPRRVKRRKRDLTLDCKRQQLLPSQPTDQASPTTVKRSSKFRGVSKHRWTGRYEAHLWDKLSWNVTQKKKGKQGNTILLIRFYFLLSFSARTPDLSLFGTFLACFCILDGIF